MDWLKNESAYFVSHDADIDGMGPIIIGKTVFGKVDYSLVNYKNIDDVIKSLIEGGVFEKYDHVFITDVCPKKETIDILDALNSKVASPLESKIYVIDHHAAALDRSGYKMADIAVEKDGTKLCATTMVLQKLKDFIPETMVAPCEYLSELTRLSDTWEWHDKGVVDADDLAELFNGVGAEKYIESMTGKIASGHLASGTLFTDEERKIVDDRRTKMLAAYTRAYETSHNVKVNGKVVCVCDIDYEFRNGLSQYLRDIGERSNLLAIPDFKKGTMSYRVLDSETDVNEFAQKFGGGGNKAAAGSPITEEVIKAFELNQEHNVNPQKI